MNWFWPIRTGNTFFDVWSICHLCFWVVAGFNWASVALKYKALSNWWLLYVATLAVAFLWEVIEKQIFEPSGYVHHPEIWYNRWLSDPLIGLIGVTIGVYLVSKQ